MGLIFNGNGDVIKAVDGSLTVEGLDLGGSSNVNAGIGTFSGNLNVGGVLTYEDVKNVDSVGIVTARAGIKVPDDQRIRLGAANDLDIYHTTSGTSWIRHGNTSEYFVIEGDQMDFRSYTNSHYRVRMGTAVELRHNNIERLKTSSTGIDVTGKLRIDIATGGTVGSGNAEGIFLRNTQETDNNAVTIFGGADDYNSAASAINFVNVDHSANYGDISFDTRGSSGYGERFRITSTGKVGIGTDNPVGNLEVRDSKANLIVAKDGLTVKNNSDIATQYDLIQLGAGGALASYSTATATADTQFIHNAYRHSGGNWKYRYADTAMRFRMNSPGNTFIFESAASGSADADITFSEKLRIDSSGRLLLGTTTEGSTSADDLTIATTGTTGITLRSGTGSAGNIEFSDGTSGTDEYRGIVQYHHNGDSMRFFTNATEKVRIDSSGRLRVGNTTESADSAFDDLIVGSHSGNRGITILSTNGQQGALGFAKSGTLADGYVAYVHNSTATSSAMTIKSSGHIQFNAGSSEKLRITSDGNVKIGDATTDYTYKLTVSGNATTNTGLFMHDGAAGTWFGIQTQGANGLVILRADARSGAYPPLTFNVGGSERLRIHSNGQVTIGSDTANGYTDRQLTLYNASTCYLEVRTNAGDNNSGIIFSKGTAQNSDSYRGYIAYNHSTDRMTFHTGGGTRRGMFDANGLHFDTNNNSAETGLDDYEEGSFTPSINGMGSISYSVQAGKYTKIGNTVFFQIRFNLSSRTAGSHAHITNMPFTASTATIQYAQCTFYAIQGVHCSSNHHPIGQFQSSEIYLYQVGYQSSSNYSNIDENQISGTAQFGVYGFYYTS